MTTQTIEESTMFYTLEPRPLSSKCPRCDSTNTFLASYSQMRYCNNCDKPYTAKDESRLREKKLDESFHMRLSVY